MVNRIVYLGNGIINPIQAVNIVNTLNDQHTGSEDKKR